MKFGSIFLNKILNIQYLRVNKLNKEKRNQNICQNSEKNLDHKQLFSPSFYLFKSINLIVNLIQNLLFLRSNRVSLQQQFRNNIIMSFLNNIIY